MLEKFLDPKIYGKPQIIELVKYVKNKCWLHLFDESTLTIIINKVREYLINFSEDGLCPTIQVQGNHIKLVEESLGKIMDIPAIGMRIVKKNNPQ